jgi:hypothetical protein
VAVLFSSFSSPFLSGAFTLGLFVVGRSMPELREMISKLGSPALKGLLYGATHVVPDLSLFFVSGSMLDGQYTTVHSEYVDWSYVATASGYGLAYAGCALFLAILLFSRRDFT